MAQASFWQKQSLDLTRRLARLKLDRQVLAVVAQLGKTARGSQRWLVGLLVLTLLVFWNWKLLLATAIGAGAMLAIYLLQQGGWQAFRSQLEQWFRSPQRPFALAVGGGGLMALLAYAGATIWAESENRWLATGAIFQGVGTLLTLLLLGWQICDRRERAVEGKLERGLSELTESDPLKRAIAVRQLTRQALRGRLFPSDRQTVIESLHLLLSRETDRWVRQAAIESLHQLEAARLEPTIRAKRR